jgi:hypothetical protein
MDEKMPSKVVGSKPSALCTFVNYISEEEKKSRKELTRKIRDSASFFPKGNDSLLSIFTVVIKPLRVLECKPNKRGKKSTTALECISTVAVLAATVSGIRKIFKWIT